MIVLWKLTKCLKKKKKTLFGNELSKITKNDL